MEISSVFSDLLIPMKTRLKFYYKEYWDINLQSLHLKTKGLNSIILSIPFCHKILWGCEYMVSSFIPDEFHGSHHLLIFWSWIIPLQSFPKHCPVSCKKSRKETFQSWSLVNILLQTETAHPFIFFALYCMLKIYLVVLWL